MKNNYYILDKVPEKNLSELKKTLKLYNLFLDKASNNKIKISGSKENLLDYLDQEKESYENFHIYEDSITLKDKKRINDILKRIKDESKKIDLSKVEGTVASAFANLDKKNFWANLIEKAYHNSDPYKVVREEFLKVLENKDIKETDKVRAYKNRILNSFDKNYLNLGYARSLKGAEAIIKFVYNILLAATGEKVI